jgi:protoporphyrinogen/coproporphyrinogen III oxidase
MQDVIVIGGGISGLVCAYHLKLMRRNVLLIDSAPRVGGSIRTDLVDGFLFERGPDSFHLNKATEDLIRYLRLEDDLLPADSPAPVFVFRHQKLRLFPNNLWSLLTSGLLSAPGKLRAILGAFVRKSPASELTTISEFMIRQYGQELHDAMIAPLVAAKYAGSPTALSAIAAAPFDKLVEQATDSGASFLDLLGVAKLLSDSLVPASLSGRRLCAFVGGLETLTQSLQAKLENETLLGCAVRQIECTETGKRRQYAVHAEFLGETQPFRASALVIATPARNATDLLQSLAPRLAHLLQEIPYSPMASVSLACHASQLPKELLPLRGYGFLTSRSKEVRTLACLWNSALFPGRAPANHHTLTALVGGVEDSAIMLAPDEEIIDIVQSDLKKAMKMRGDAKVLGVTRRELSIPQYAVGHTARIHEMNALVQAMPGLYVTGNYLSGVGVEDCIERSTSLAETIEDYLAHTVPPIPSYFENSRIR